MSLKLDDLDNTTRRHMRAEFYMDLTRGAVPLPERLNASGRIMFPVALEAAIERGDDATLSAALRENGFVREREEFEKDGKTFARLTPWDAADRIAERAFNHYFMRGVCRRAIDEAFKLVEAECATDGEVSDYGLVGVRWNPEHALECLRVGTGMGDFQAFLMATGLTLRLAREATA